MAVFVSDRCCKTGPSQQIAPSGQSEQSSSQKEGT